MFVVEQDVKHVRQGQQIVPDLVELIMRHIDPVLEELRRILSQMDQFTSEIIKIRVSTFWMPGKISDSRGRLPARAK